MNREHYLKYMITKLKPTTSPQKLISDLVFYLLCVLVTAILLYVNTRSAIISAFFAFFLIALLIPYRRHKQVIIRKMLIVSLYLSTLSIAVMNIDVILLKQIDAYQYIPYGIIIILSHIFFTQLYIYRNLKKNVYHNKEVKYVRKTHMIIYVVASLIGFLLSYVLGLHLNNNEIIILYLIFSFWAIAWLISISIIYFQLYIWYKKSNLQL